MPGRRPTPRRRRPWRCCRAVAATAPAGCRCRCSITRTSTARLSSGDCPGSCSTGAKGAPDPAIERDSWSALVSGQIQPEVSDTYTFFLHADDGFNLWLDGQPVLEFWQRRAGGRPVAFSRPLQAGRRYDFVIEYFDDLGGAFLDLTWKRPGTARAAIPQCALFEPPLRPARCPGPYPGAPSRAPWAARRTRGWASWPAFIGTPPSRRTSTASGRSPCGSTGTG